MTFQFFASGSQVSVRDDKTRRSRLGGRDDIKFVYHFNPFWSFVIPDLIRDPVSDFDPIFFASGSRVSARDDKRDRWSQTLTFPPETSKNSMSVKVRTRNLERRRERERKWNSK
ncbi:MAG: hypothetical protein AUJ19_00035 [Parcubacteria group bacterium CG1_02_58_44]|nr:MAG: hypothetical protein AUJ19_00035 [Parcubacteria group bacterium CG1_02_58_44]